MNFYFYTITHCVTDLQLEDDIVPDPSGTQESSEVIATRANRRIRQDLSAG